MEIHIKLFKLFFDIYNHAIERGLPRDNLCLYARSEILDDLGIIDKLKIRITSEKYQFEYDLMVKSGDKIMKVNFEDNSYKSEIYITDPDWLIEKKCDCFFCKSIEDNFIIDKED